MSTVRQQDHIQGDKDYKQHEREKAGHIPAEDRGWIYGEIH